MVEVHELLVTALAAAPEPNIPNPAPKPPPGFSNPAAKVVSWVKWGGLVMGSIGLIVCAIQMMVGRKGRSSMAADGATGLPWVGAGLVVMGTASSLIGAMI